MVVTSEDVMDVYNWIESKKGKIMIANPVLDRVTVIGEFCVMWGCGNSFELYRILSNKHAVGFRCGYCPDKERLETTLTCLGEGVPEIHYWMTYELSGLSSVLGVPRLVNIAFPNYGLDERLKLWPWEKVEEDIQARNAAAYEMMRIAYADLMDVYNWKESTGHMLADITQEQRAEFNTRAQAIYNEQRKRKS